ncbi:MAG: PDZ domain-containing protein [bacterium JZ-2024 1]
MQVPPAGVYPFLTVPANLQEWLCHRAVGSLAPGFACVLLFPPERAVIVRCEDLKAPETVTLKWREDDDPGESQVVFFLEKLRSGSRVHLTHSAIGTPKEWRSFVGKLEKTWDRSLENLKSVLETGIDLRTARRPFLGIGFAEVTPEEAASEGIPSGAGIRVTEVVSNSGADRSGLQRGDVIVRIGTRAIANGIGLLCALEEHSAGDTVNLQINRKGKLKNIRVTLSARGIGEIPATHLQVVEDLRRERRNLIAELDSLIAGVPEETAEMKPAPDKWCAKEVLAHLILSEQFFRTLMVLEFAGATVDPTENVTVYPETLGAVLRVNPTLKSLRNRLQAEQDETLAVLEMLRDKYRNQRARYRRMVLALNEFAKHTRHHFRQLTLAIQGKPLK